MYERGLKNVRMKDCRSYCDRYVHDRSSYSQENFDFLWVSVSEEPKI